MIKELPIFVNILFGITVLGTIAWFYLASKSRTFLIIAIGWTILQTILGLIGIYQDTESMPPRIMVFAFLPALMLIVTTFLISKGKTFIDRIDLKTLTYFHTIRIPVEIVLTLLYYQGLMSVLITFEGTNFDLFSGITAPIIAYFTFQTNTKNKKLLLSWNVLCLLLLLNVVITAIFSTPFPFQMFSFDQPNIAILYFPFHLLPTVIVPTVLFGHLVAIRQLIKNK